MLNIISKEYKVIEIKLVLGEKIENIIDLLADLLSQIKLNPSDYHLKNYFR
jgi:hypothetical protein